MPASQSCKILTGWGPEKSFFHREALYEVHNASRSLLYLLRMPREALPRYLIARAP